MEFQDKTLVCFDCDNNFTFSVDEQEEFHSKGHHNDPKRCPECRQARKANRPVTSNNTYGGGGYGFTARRQLFPAVCAECGKETQVPFEPSQGRPVYCSDCYRNVRPNR